MPERANSARPGGLVRPEQLRPLQGPRAWSITLENAFFVFLIARALCRHTRALQLSPRAKFRVAWRFTPATEAVGVTRNLWLTLLSGSLSDAFIASAVVIFRLWWRRRFCFSTLCSKRSSDWGSPATAGKLWCSLFLPPPSKKNYLIVRH